MRFVLACFVLIALALAGATGHAHPGMFAHLHLAEIDWCGGPC